MTPEQLAALAQAAKSRTGGDAGGMTPDMLQVIAQRAREQSSEALAAMGQPRVPEGFVLNPATGQMEDLRSPINPNFQGEGAGASAATGAGQGLSFGFMDEAVGNAFGGIQSLRGQGGFAENRDYGTEVQRERLRRARERDPVTAYGSEIAGGVATGVTGGMALGASRALTPGQQVAQGFGIGAAEGAIYGAGAGEGGLTERLPDAAMGGVVGGVIGGAAVPAVAAARAAGRGVSNPIMALANQGNNSRAARMMQRSMQRADVDENALAQYLQEAASEGQPEFMAADALGIEGQRALSGIARSPGDSRQAVTQVLEARQAGAPDRMSAFLADALGSSDTAQQRAAQMEAQRGATADQLYQASREGAGPVDVRGAVAAIDDFITPYAGSGVTPPPLVTQLQGIRNRMSAPNPPAGTTAVELSDYDSLLRLKRELDGLATTASRSGDNFAAGQIGAIKRELDSALEQASPGYRAANDQFRVDSFAMDQIKAGQRAAAPRVRSDDTVRQFSQLPQSGSSQVPAAPGQVPMDPRAAFRVGYGEPQFAKIANAGPNANPSTPFTRPKSVAEMQAIALDPQLFQRRVGREQTMGETRRQATGGSMTAQNIADNAEMSGAELGGFVEAARDIGNLNVGNVIARGAQALQGQNEGTREILARLLTSNDPKPIIDAISKSRSAQGKNQMILEAILRNNMNRPAIDALR